MGGLQSSSRFFGKRTKKMGLWGGIVSAMVLVSSIVYPAVLAEGTSASTAEKEKTVVTFQERKLTIIHTNDRHGHTESDPYVAQMKKDLIAKGERVLVLDAGDSLHGQIPANLSGGSTMVELMNMVGYDAMAVGNHDFNYGYDRLQELIQEMQFPLLAANIRKADGELFLKPYQVFMLDGLKVGVFGLATPETIKKTDPRAVAGLTFEDPVTAAKPIVNKLKESEGCDVVIGLTHLGVDEEDTIPANRSTALTVIPGIDVIIDGHSDTVLQSGKMVDRTLLAQAGGLANYFGVVELTVPEDTMNRPITKTAKLIPVPKSGESTTLSADPTIVAKIEDHQSNVKEITDLVAGKTPYFLDGSRESLRAGETNLSNFITDSMRAETGADVAFLSAGNIRESIEAGDITMGHILMTLPFSNLLVTVDLTGAELRSILEYGVSTYPELEASFIQVSGLTLQFDPNVPKNRITNVTLDNGEPLDDSKTYKVATIDFIAAGGDGYTQMTSARNKMYFKADSEALVHWLATEPVITEQAAGRVRPVVVE